MASRYYQQNVAQYNPLSFEEMLFAPSMMRQNHDQLDQGLATTNTELGQYNSLSQDNDFVQKAIDPVSAQLNTMAESLSKEGFNRQQMSGFRKIRAEKDNLFGAQGDVGIAQARYASFQAQSADLKKQYEKNPKIANYFINKLGQSKGLSRDSQGNIQNQSLDAIDNVRHYDAKEIGDLINGQVDNIKATLLDQSIMKREHLEGLSSVQDLYVAMEKYGIDPDRAKQILKAQISPEVLASVRQYGKIQYGDEQMGDLMLENQIIGAAEGISGTHRIDYDRKIIDNQDAIFDRNKKNEEEIPFISTGGRISEEALNPFSSLQINNEGNISLGNKETALSSGKYGYISGTGAVAIEDIQKTIQYNEKAQEFKKLKESLPQLKDLSDKDALSKVNAYYKDKSERFGTVEQVSLDNPNFVRTILTMGGHSPVYTENGKTTTLTEVMEGSKYANVNEYITENKQAYRGYTKFGPKGLPAHQFMLSDGSTFFIEGEVGLQNLSERSTTLNQLILSGKTSDSFVDDTLELADGQFVSTKAVNINPIATDDDPYQLELIQKDSRANANDLILPYIKGKTQQEVKRILKTNFNMLENKDYKIESMTDINREENEIINKTLKYMRK